MSGEMIKVGKLEIHYLVDGAEKGRLGVFEMTVPAGAIVPPPHSHTDNEECVYVLEGTLRYTVDGVSRDTSRATGCRRRGARSITSSTRPMRRCAHWSS